jgi:hypothetical protein
MTESTLDRLADAVLKLSELHVEMVERLTRMDVAWRQGAYDQPVECVDPDEWRRLQQDVEAIERRTRYLEPDHG